MPFRPYNLASAHSASLLPTSCLFVGWMFPASPTSMITAMPVFLSPSAMLCASRNPAHSLSEGASNLCM